MWIEKDTYLSYIWGLDLGYIQGLDFSFKQDFPPKVKKCNLGLIGKENIVPEISKSASGMGKFPFPQGRGLEQGGLLDPFQPKPLCDSLIYVLGLLSPKTINFIIAANQTLFCTLLSVNYLEIFHHSSYISMALSGLKRSEFRGQFWVGIRNFSGGLERTPDGAAAFSTCFPCTKLQCCFLGLC